MAEERYLVNEGYEISTEDLQLMSDDGAYADDRVLAELLRLPVFNGTSVAKAVLPYAMAGSDATELDPNGATVVPSGTDGSVRVNPFRVLVAPQSSSVSGKDAWQKVRSAISVGALALQQTVALNPTSANPRWTLIYARLAVDVDGTTIDRYYKDSSGVTLKTLAVTTSCTVILGTVDGAEGATPARPSLPADSSPDFYIPIAYVYVPNPFTSTSTIAATSIQDAAPVVGLSRAVGGKRLRPANQFNAVGGTLLATNDWTSYTARPGPFLPPSMQGGEGLFVPMMFGASGTSGNTLGATTVIDDSVDWRKRIFRVTAFAYATAHYPWDATGSAWAPTEPGVFMGQSFFDDGTGLGTAAGGVVAILNNAKTGCTAMAASANVILFVDASDGKLKAYVEATNPNCAVFLWIDASAPYGNA